MSRLRTHITAMTISRSAAITAPIARRFEPKGQEASFEIRCGSGVPIIFTILNSTIPTGRIAVKTINHASGSEYSI